MKVKIKKCVALIMLLATLLSAFSNIAFATEITSADLTNCGDCGHHLMYWKEAIGNWSYVTTTFVAYNQNGVQYPAYCLDKDAAGVGEAGDYSVDVSQVINDVRLWRVAINGYPYQSTAQLGVENEDDAFVATKQAIYCILYDWDAEGRYAGGDARGDAIKNAIVNLVNIGRYGSQTPANTDVNVLQVGGFEEDGDYYSQKYRIDAPVETSIYTIIATPGMPAGGRITDLNGNEKATFGGSEQFKVQVPKSQLSSDINMSVAVRAKSKTYPVFYGSSSIPGTQDYLLTYDPFGDTSGQATLNIKTNTGIIKINKLDDETSQPIEGVTFELTKEDGTVVGNATTNEDGIATFSSLYQGAYILRELETNEKYILNETPFNIKVEYNKTTTQDIENEHKKGNIKVYKIDKDNKRVVLGNVEFDLYSHEFDKVIGTYNTDVNGELEIKDLRIGDYSLIEKKTNKWYNLADDTDILVEWNLTKELQIENELMKGQIKIIKVDMDNNEVKLQGVKFGVYDENDNLLETITTDENGETLTKRYPVRDFEKLKLVEEETKEEYVLNDEPQTIVLEANQIKNITFENERIKGKLDIEKVDSKDHNKKLSNVEFGIYDENDNLVQTVITDENGFAETEDLYKGKYYAKELKAASEYYLLNDEKYEFEIVNHREVIQKQIENEPVDIKVDVDKEGTTEIVPGAMVDYTFSNVANSSNIYLDNFKWFDYIPTDYIRLQTMTTGTWNQDLNYNVYYKTNKTEDYVLFQENLSTNEDYTLDFTTLELAEDEYITETMFDFGKVDVGFKEATSPTMQCKSFDTLTESDVFTNKTKTVGVYQNITAESNSKWTTIVHTPEKVHETVLPKTGK